VHHKGNAKERRERVADIFKRVGLRAEQVDNFPHQFSGGQRQRIGIARALALEPSLIIGDEPVSALDVSTQASIMRLLMEIRAPLRASYLLISHDLSLVRHVAHRVGVMYLGKLVEMGTVDEIFRPPSHPYTRALLSAIPRPDPFAPRAGIRLEGAVPSAQHPPSGCRFHSRCSAPARATGLRATYHSMRCDEGLPCSPRRLLRTAPAPSRMEKPDHDTVDPYVHA
jgi:oligopeptide/dipeptide ABC transporter ATP-binding protein